MNHELILKRLGDMLGLPIEFDDCEQCVLMIDEHLVVSLTPQDQDWLLRCMVTEVEPEFEQSTFKTAMQLNSTLSLTNSGHLFFEENSRALLYVARIAAEDGDTLYQGLSDTVTQYENIQNLLVNQPSAPVHFDSIGGQYANSTK
ncbi:CesT family type III secretion system chaperone [Vibrio ostreicida]|uniref:CesT family type III secretion system chaperone n=1 Tax=Vibrio ostreicida TaxID=526588 RepID=A0ABT8BU99_9VIBR|nr:CesT family type III secretion system chaperone [Vibrio ostreicida]MDN3610024.1 CesT family type III secretion system chaperone [Vibrio ostreicida]NPD10449.1 chaperone SicP [Vibrio ostreicida]